MHSEFVTEKWKDGIKQLHWMAKVKVPYTDFDGNDTMKEDDVPQIIEVATGGGGRGWRAGHYVGLGVFGATAAA